MKTVDDALVLRNWLIALLERAEIEPDVSQRRALLTIVVAGGGFSGVETIGALNDFVREIARDYPKVSAEEVSFVLVEPQERLLPEFEIGLARYAESKLRETGIDVRLRTGVAGFDGGSVVLKALTDSERPVALSARTLIWTAGITPVALIESLPVQKERGRIVVTETMALPGHEGVWACGDCAAIPDPSGKSYPTTAQHAMREGAQVGRNIASALLGRPEKIRPFRYKMIGQLAAIGDKVGIASIFGVRFSGFIAWLLWRTTYLFKLPGRAKKVRVMLEWLVDLCFRRDTVQLLSVQIIRSGRLEELMESARAAESADRTKPEAIASPVHFG